MKKYIGTKTVKAAPMLKGEAYDRGLLKAGTVVESEEQRNQKGYIVEYEDGYQSWSPKDVFEKAYKLAETWSDRLNIEREELDAKIEKLEAALDNSRRIPECQVELMKKQLVVMRQYAEILLNRSTAI